jgi:hypothetical protein
MHFTLHRIEHPREAYEIRIGRDVALAWEMSAPYGFAEEFFEAHGKCFSGTNYVWWTGKLPLPRNKDVLLEIPAKQLGAMPGRLTIYYHRTDDASEDHRGVAIIELK